MGKNKTIFDYLNSYKEADITELDHDHMEHHSDNSHQEHHHPHQEQQYP